MKPGDWPSFRYCLTVFYSPTEVLQCNYHPVKGVKKNSPVKLPKDMMLGSNSLQKKFNIWPFKSLTRNTSLFRFDPSPRLHSHLLHSSPLMPAILHKDVLPKWPTVHDSLAWLQLFSLARMLRLFPCSESFYLVFNTFSRFHLLYRN